MCYTLYWESLFIYLLVYYFIYLFTPFFIWNYSVVINIVAILLNKNQEQKMLKIKSISNNIQNW